MRGRRKERAGGGKGGEGKRTGVVRGWRREGGLGGEGREGIGGGLWKGAWEVEGRDRGRWVGGRGRSFCSLRLVSSPSAPPSPLVAHQEGFRGALLSCNRLLFPVTARLRLAVIGLAGEKSGCNCEGRDGERVDVMARALWVFDKTWPSRRVSQELFKMFVSIATGVVADLGSRTRVPVS
ncbi:hypothetical protein Pcinc_044395 [Petrolisthes cinctipes]|uniref:Uncharacterized protein n=1 Tax=Petrolisthes cinctipes TaxID=88211 RepID=A0AAE1BH73_PETCI|nr:hypothetical protein Pcinc_044395 [Petrolisthes cinctipes]